jgi:lysophospholipase L1-like esterase
MMHAIAFCLIVLSQSNLSGETVVISTNAGSKGEKSAMKNEERVLDARKRRGNHYADRMKIFLSEESNIKPGGVIFLGDSITEGFPTAQAFPDENVINRGIGGDVIDGVIERLDVCVFNLKPKRVYLMIGINNIWWFSPDAPVEELGKQYDNLVMKTKEGTKETEIVLLSILPVGGKEAAKNTKVRALNDIISRIARRENLAYIDLHPIMKDAKGNLREEFSADGVHLNLKGYLAWLEIMLPPDEFFKTAVNLMPFWKKKCGRSYKIDKIDPEPEGSYPGTRGPNELVVYTKDYAKKSTGTNEWGMEAVVRNGVVVKKEKNNSPIPEDGYVISGHGDAANWISSIISVDAKVTRTGDEIILGDAPASDIPLSAPQRLFRLHDLYYETLSNLVYKKATSESLSEAKEILLAIRKIDLDDKENELMEIEKLENLIRNLK